MRVREFAVPLQAFLFIGICFSLVWMLYAMALYDPTPPTMDEVNSAVTHDPEINDLRTSAAQTVSVLFGFGPTQIFLTTPTPSLTPTVTPTVISVANTITPRPATATYTAVIEPTWTDDRTREDPTAAPTRIRPTVTFTPRPTHTSPPRPTNTDAPPPTHTDEPPPTHTDEPPPTKVDPTQKPPDPTEESTPAASGNTQTSP